MSHDSGPRIPMIIVYCMIGFEELLSPEGHHKHKDLIKQ